MRFVNASLLLLLIILLVRLFAGEGSVGQVFALEKKIEVQTQLNQQLKRRNEKLADEVIDLQNGYDAIEAYARSELGMIKPNETFFLIIPAEKK